MRIAVISDTRLPTREDGGHGLGMSAHSIASGLVKLAGHQVDLFAGPGSEYEAGELHVFGNETEAAVWLRNNYYQVYDAILDTSHSHKLSTLAWAAPVVNRICDLECTYNPPCAVVNSPFMASRYPAAKLVNTGIDAPGAYFSYDPGQYLLYASAFTGNNGYHTLPSLERQLDTNGRLRVMHGLTGADRWQVLAGATALVMLSTASAAPRLPIEAGMMGTPVLCLSGDGAEYHVINDLTGYVCHSLEDLAEKVGRIPSINRKACRAWMLEHHGYKEMIENYDQLLKCAANGGTW